MSEDAHGWDSEGEDDSSEFHITDIIHNAFDFQERLAEWIADRVNESAEALKAYGGKVSSYLTEIASRRVQYKKNWGLVITGEESLLPRIMELPDFSQDHVDLYTASLVYAVAEKVFSQDRKGMFLCDFVLDEAEKLMPKGNFFHNSIQREKERLAKAIMERRVQTKQYIEQRLHDAGYDNMTVDELLAGKKPVMSETADQA